MIVQCRENRTHIDTRNRVAFQLDSTKKGLDEQVSLLLNGHVNVTYFLCIQGLVALKSERRYNEAREVYQSM